MLKRASKLAAHLLCCCALMPCAKSAAQSSVPVHRQARETAMPGSDAASLDRALAAYNAGNASAAMPDLIRLAQKYPGNFPANEALGLLYLEAGSYREAIPYLQHAAETSRTNPAAQANLGAAYLQTGDAEPAIEALRRAATLDPRNGEALTNLGHALFLNKQPAQAADAFRRAAAVDSSNMDTRYNWAVALHQAGRNTQADTVLGAIPTAQRSAAEESLWGDVSESLGHFKDAALHMQAAVRLDPSEQNIYDLAVELLRHWTWQAAEDMAQYGMERFPDSHRLILAKGIAIYGSGHYAEAANTFGTLLKLEPGNEGYGKLLGSSCLAPDGYKGTPCSELVAFADEHPGNASIDAYAAASILNGLSQDNSLDHAQQLLERAIAEDSHLAEAYYQLGVLEQQRLEWGPSVDNLKKAVQLRPGNTAAHYRLARAYYRLHQTDLGAKEVALVQRYTKQEKAESNERFREVTTFLIASH